MSINACMSVVGEEMLSNQHILNPSDKQTLLECSAKVKLIWFRIRGHARVRAIQKFGKRSDINAKIQIHTSG